jgi:hypothetical protein
LDVTFMSELRFLRALPACVLAFAIACGESPAPNPSAGNTDNSGADDDDDVVVDDAGKPTASLDAGAKIDAGVKVDAGAASGGAGDAKVATGTTPDAGIKTDAGVKTDAAVTPGDTDAGPITTLPSVRPKPKCMKKDSQLIVIGDSYINWVSHTFPDDIVKESGQKWRMEAIGGTSMGSGGIGFIPDQFDSSIKKDADAHTIVMDGGGNDILVADPSIDLFHECQDTGSSTKPNCQKIVKMAIDAATKLMDRMVAAGIRDVVYFFYPHVPANTLLSGPNPDEILDYALPMVRDFCEGREAATGGKLRCKFVDLVPVFAGHMDWFNSDIHENSLGSAAIAKTLWGVMKDQCIGQKTGAGCCEE